MLGLDWTFCTTGLDKDSDDSCAKIARLCCLFLQEAQECDIGEQNCPNCPWVGEMEGRVEMKNALHVAVEQLGKMGDRGEFGQWVSYLLEEIEVNIGTEALERVGNILRERFAWEGWQT
ncbi:MAG: hypothetical protein KAY24_00365 [Candidatus Eisenbacteria sp.]|nr:hypothetical protein [Candidatus Eisenbacteria bacterium]